MGFGLIFFALLWRYFFHNQLQELGFNTGNITSLPSGLWQIVAVVVFVYVLYLVKKRVDIDKPTKWLCYITSVIVAFFSTYIANPFYDGDIEHGHQIGFLHFNIVWESIYNVLDGVPFTLDTTPLYGHYALFFLPLKAVDGWQYIYGISIGFALLVAVEQIFFLYIVDTFAPKNWVGAILAIGGVQRIVYIAYHLIPIRSFFPIALLAFFTYLYKNQESIRSRNIYIVTVVFLTMALLCNLEIGACCLVAFCVYVVLERVCAKERWQIICRESLKAVFLVLIAIVLAIVIVNIYNLLCEGPFITKEFFFPLIGSDTNIVAYIQDNFHWPVPLGLYPWEAILPFGLGTFCAVIFMATTNKTPQQISIAPLLGSMVCLLLGAFSYYMNEPLWTDLVIYKHIIYCMFAIILGQIYERLNDCKNISLLNLLRVVVIFIVGVSMFGAIQIVNDPVRIAARQWVGAYDGDKMEQEIGKIDISDNVYGFGSGVNMIYHVKGLNNHMKFRDVTELDLPYYPTFEKAINDLKAQNYVLMNTSYYYDKKTIEKFEARGFSFKELYTWEVGDQIYSYCSITYDGHNEK